MRRNGEGKGSWLRHPEHTQSFQNKNKRLAQVPRLAAQQKDAEGNNKINSLKKKNIATTKMFSGKTSSWDSFYCFSWKQKLRLKKKYCAVSWNPLVGKTHKADNDSFVSPENRTLRIKCCTINKFKCCGPTIWDESDKTHRRPWIFHSKKKTKNQPNNGNLLTFQSLPKWWIQKNKYLND